LIEHGKNYGIFFAVGVINAIVAIIQPEEDNGFMARQKMLDRFREQDGGELRRSLQDTVAENAGTEQPLLFDHLVIHPLKLHISFSLTGAESALSSIFVVRRA
jgi:hypothetical protein